MDREEFKRRSSTNRDVLDRVRDAIGPVSAMAVSKLTGCSTGTLYRVLDRPAGSGEFRQSGPPTVNMSGADLHAWLQANLPDRDLEDYARILRAVADDLTKEQALTPSDQ